MGGYRLSIEIAGATKWVRVLPSGGYEWVATRAEATEWSGQGASAQHIVRGHFAHYGDCCPGRHEPRGLLFGKYSGRVFVPDHVRGDPERGIVVKDYEVRTDPSV